MSQLKAPNGKPSNLTPEQWKLVRTPQFKAWFGDWENDPENASKIVDENGEPLVVYHGSRFKGNIYKFEHLKEEKLDWTKDSFGFYFSDDKDYAKGYGENIYQCFLNIKNPKLSIEFEHTYLPYHKIHKIINDGYDGVYFNGSLGNRDYDKDIFYEKEIVAFDPEQIKLADGSNTTFDGKNPDIRFAQGGTMNTIQQGDALIYKDSEFLDFDNVIYVEDVSKSAHGTIYTLSNGQSMFETQLKKKFRKANEGEINRSNIMSKEIFSKGGKTRRYMKKIKRGGITYGKSHAEGGIPVKNQSTGDMLEVEGGEGIVNKRSMASDKKVKLNGKEMTICEAVSQLNQMEGGVQFSCDDVEDRQFIEAMARGGELERGVRTEQEHIQVLKDLYAKRITPKQASKRIAKDHLKEDSRYYSKLAKMEGKMAKGGEIFDKETEDLLSDLTKKYAKGGEVVADKTETINMKDFEGYADQYNGRKNKFFKANDEYQLLVNEGMELKNNTTLPQDEKNKLLAELREKAREAKTTLGEKRKDFVDMREVKSPFYAPQLEDGGKIPKSVSKAIENLQVGDYKFKIKHSFLPQKGVDVFLKIHHPREVVEGELKFQIGNRNLNKFNQRAVVNDVLNKYLKIDPSLWAFNSIGRSSKSTFVDLVLAKELIPQSQNIALQILKALTNADFYKNDVLATNPTTTPPTEKEDDWNWRFKTEEELKAELGDDIHKIKDGSVFATSMRYLLGKKINETQEAVEAIFKVNQNTYGGVEVNTQKVFGIGNPKQDIEWYISSWMITDKPLAGEEVPPTESKKEITNKDAEDELMRWAKEKTEEKNDNSTRKYQLHHLISYILLNQARGKMSDFTQFIAMAKESRKLEQEILRLSSEKIPIDSFVMKLLINRYSESVKDLKSQIMLFVKYESDIAQELGNIHSHIPYLAELDTFDKDYIIYIK